MIKFLFFCTGLISTRDSTTCDSKFYEYLFGPQNIQTALVCLPVVYQDSLSTLIIQKKDLAKYLSSLDTNYTDDRVLRQFVEDVINKKRDFYFSDFAYDQFVGLNGFKRLYKPPDKISDPDIDFAILKTYLSELPEKNKYLLIDEITMEKFDEIVVSLFKMHYVTSLSHGSSYVVRIVCDYD